jgi:uncharacterized protein
MTVFVDTAYLIALLDERDNLNERARTLTAKLAAERAELVTSDAVVLEFANYFARSPLRNHAARWIAAFRRARSWEIVAVEREVLHRAEARYGRHRDKTWSLTDCHSMEVMRERQIRRVATTDLGFQQAGFQCLLLR